jgi:alkyl hydroperoxide reductase subunit AhpC
MLMNLLLLFAFCCVGIAFEVKESLVLRPRQTAPLFTAKSVLDDKFIDLSLSDSFSANKWTVLLFYPFDYTFVCPTEIISFSEHNQEFLDINTKVLAISTDSHHTHLSWTRTSREDGGVGKLQIPLVADVSKRISASYGVLVTDEADDMFGKCVHGLCCLIVMV